MVKLNRFQKQGERAFKIYDALGPGPFTVMQVEKVLGLHRIGPIIGSLREDGIVVHHDGSQMPMVRKIGETRKSPL